MSVLWLAPMALLGLALVAVPVAIHLLVRQQSRRIAYPSLRFLRQSQLAALRRRNIQDALLLACRAAIVASAAIALGGPVLQTASRSAAYGARVVRAVVVEPGVAPAAEAEARGDAFQSRIFGRTRASDAIDEAARWLAEQSPASREIVFVGEFRRGSVTPGDLQAVPSATGVRFISTAGAPAAREVFLPVLRSPRSGEGSGLVIERRPAYLDDESTRVTAGGAEPAASDVVRIVAAPADQSLADAALRAALAEGLRWRDSPQRVLIAWTGVAEAVAQRAVAGALLVRMDRPEPVSSAASAVVEAVEQVSADAVATLEPVRISQEQLQAWSRAPGGVPPSARPADEGDRRWFWVLALTLLGTEHLLRRAVTRQAAVESAVEARVA